MDTLFHLIFILFLFQSIPSSLLWWGIIGSVIPDLFRIYSIFNAVVRNKPKSRRLWVWSRISHSFLIVPIILAPFAIKFAQAKYMLLGVLLHLIIDVLCHYKRVLMYFYPHRREFMTWNRYEWGGFKSSGIIIYPWSYLFWGGLSIIWMIQVVV